MCLGIDFGGSKIEIIVLDEDGQLLLCCCVVLLCDDYVVIVVMFVDLVCMVEVEFGQQGSVGIGIFGVEFLVMGLIKNVNFIWLIGWFLCVDFECMFGCVVCFVNDVNCFVLFEVVDGVVVGVVVVFGVIFGIGVGGGIVVNGSVLQGVNLIVGEWGYNYFLCVFFVVVGDVF